MDSKELFNQLKQGNQKPELMPLFEFEKEITELKKLVKQNNNTLKKINKQLEDLK